MKKQVKILMLVIILIIACTLTVNASDATASLNLSSVEVHKGDTFTVTLNVTCEEGINGLQGTVNYDTTKLDLVNIAVTDTTKWVNLGENLNLAVIHNSSDTETSTDIVKVTLKVKDTAEVGEAKVTISDIVVDSDAASNSTKQVGTKEIEVSITENTSEPGNNPSENPGETPQDKTLTGIEITKAPTKITYTAGEKFDKTGMIVKLVYSDGTKKETTDYKIANGEKLEANQKSVLIHYTYGDRELEAIQEITVVQGTNSIQGTTVDKNKTQLTDNTKTDKKIPYTGLTSIIGVIVVIGLVGTVSYIKYNKYKKI